MADGGPQTVEQRILLILEERLAGAGKAAQALKNIYADGGKATKALNKYTQSTAKAGKATSNFTKAAYNMGSAFGNIAKVLGTVGMMTKAFVGTTGFLYSRLVKNNKAFLDMGIAVSNVDKIMFQLRKHNDDMVTSMQDAAESIADFTNQSIAARALMSESPELAEKIMQAQEKLAQAVGKSTAMKMFQEFQKSVPATMIRDIFAKPEMFGTEELFERLQRFDSDAANIYERIMNGMEGVGKSTDPIIRGVRDWERFMSKLSTTVDIAAAIFMDKFGDIIPGALDHIEKELIPKFLDGIRNIADWIGSHGEQITYTLKKITDAVSWLLNVITNMHPALIALTGAIAFVPGTIPLLGLIGKGMWGIVKHTWRAGAAVLGLGKNLKNMQSTLSTVGCGGKVAAFAKIAGGAAFAAYSVASLADSIASVWKGERAAKWNLAGRLGNWVSGDDKYYDAKEGMEKGLSDSAKKQKESLSPKVRKLIDEGRVDEARKLQAKLSGTKIDKWKFGKAMDWVKDKIKDATAATQDFSKKLNNMTPGRQFEKYATEWKEIERGIKGAASAAGVIEEIMKMGGFNAKVGGMTATGAAKEVSVELGYAAKQSKRIGNAMMMNAQIMLKDARILAENATTADERTKAEKQRVGAMEKYDQGASKVAEANAKIKEIIDINTANLRISYGLQKQITDLKKADLQISQNLYGSASLAVEAQLAVVDSLQKQKELKQAELAIVQQQIKVDGETPFLLERKRQLQLDIKGITVDQVSMMKELRDGYLDAVQAQAFGAGKFEKILITQEKNMGKALDKNIAKRNILLGQTGKGARRGDMTPYRFSAEGMGELQGMGGGAVDLAKRNQEFINNIADPGARAVAQMSQNLFSGMNNSMGDNTQALDRNTQAIQSLQGEKGSIDKYIEKGLKAAGAGALKGTAAGTTAVGEAMRTAGKGDRRLAGVPKLRAVDYKEPKIVTGGSILQKIHELTARINESQRSSPQMDVQGFDMQSARNIKRGRAKNRAAIRKMERNRKSLIPKMLPRAKSKPKGGGGDMENLGKTALEHLIKVGTLMIQLGTGVDVLSSADPDQVNDHQGHFTNTTLGGG